MKPTGPSSVLHYVGEDDDRGGILSAVRSLAGVVPFPCVLGVNRGFIQRRSPPLPVLELPPVAGEQIGPTNFLRCRGVALEVRAWLREDPVRIYHGHSRAGLLVALWLHLMGERRVVVSVHCYGRQRWFYRFARALLGARLVWLSPAMKRHYGLPDRSWSGCIPNGLGAPFPAAMRRGPGPDGRLRLGGAGLRVAWKRWDLVIAALALPPAAKVHFIHIGGAVDSDESRACEKALQAQTASRGLADRVEWRDWQPSSAGLLAEVDAVLVPSDGEPFSMIALEAMFAGVPVIATRGGGPEDLIVDGVNGWLVPPGDALALAACIESLKGAEAWAGLRVMPDHLRRFALKDGLAARWSELYGSLDRPKG